MKNGFILIGFLFLLPILLLAAFLTLFSFDVIKNYTTLQNECRKHVLKAQQIMGRNLQTLLDLNPQAEELRNTEKILREKLKASITPIDAGIVAGMLAANIIEQTMLRTKQEGLILQSQTQAQSEFISFSHLTQQVAIPPARLQVTFRPPTAIAPNFYTVKDFEKKADTKDFLDEQFF